MGIELISNAVAINQITSRPVQNMELSNPVAIGTTETSTVPKVLTGQQNENNQQNSDSQTDAQRLKNAITLANQKMKNVTTGCEFTYHEKTNRVSFKIYDKDTKEVILEMPTKESLERLEKFLEIQGLLVDERR